MRRPSSVTCAMVACAALALAARGESLGATPDFHHALLAQEGHPLVGTWYGDWGQTPQQRHDVTVIMTWDGKRIAGLIDPGPDAVPFKSATLDSRTWTVHIEAERADKTRSGTVVRYVIDGTLSNIGSYNRTFTGTWTEGAIKGDFTLTRD